MYPIKYWNHGWRYALVVREGTRYLHALTYSIPMRSLKLEKRDLKTRVIVKIDSREPVESMQAVIDYSRLHGLTVPVLARKLEVDNE